MSVHALHTENCAVMSEWWGDDIPLPPPNFMVSVIGVPLPSLNAKGDGIPVYAGSV
jgi:hypothetical protein